MDFPEPLKKHEKLYPTKVAKKLEGAKVPKITQHNNQPLELFAAEDKTSKTRRRRLDFFKKRSCLNLFQKVLEAKRKPQKTTVLKDDLILNKGPTMGKHHDLGGFPASRMLIYSYIEN